MGAPGSPITDLNLDSPAVITARMELAACFLLAALHGLEEGAAIITFPPLRKGPTSKCAWEMQKVRGRTCTVRCDACLKDNCPVPSRRLSS